MKPYSIEFRQKILEVHEKENISIYPSGALLNVFVLPKALFKNYSSNIKRPEISILTLKEEVLNLSSGQSN